MNPKLLFTLVIVFGLIGGVTGVISNKLKRTDSNQHHKHLVINSLPDFRLPDLNGRFHNSHKWQGKLLVVNYWATWCPPCRKEIPDFISLQDKHKNNNVQFVGIAIDTKAKVKTFLDNLNVNYPVLMGDSESVSQANKMGNKLDGLPFTVIFNEKGHIVNTHLGGFNIDELDNLLTKLQTKTSFIP